MGMTLTTLHVYGAGKEELEKKLATTDLLREQNAPWLSVVPEYGAAAEDMNRLGKLAAQLTKRDASAAALLFHYFDDELFTCSFYREGRKRAFCRSDESWAKLGRQLDALFGDSKASKAFRCASHCCDLEEQLALLEENVGAALLDTPEEDSSRRVPRGDATQQSIKAREALLRKRPNRFILTELAQEDWPEELKLRQALLKLLRPQWEKYHLSSLLYETDVKHLLIPGAPWLAAYPYIDFERRRDGLLFYDSKTGERWEPGALPGHPWRALWRTRSDGIALLFYSSKWENADGTGWRRSSGQGSVICLGPDGEERWRFAPKMLPHQQLAYVHTAADGVITLYAPGNSNVREDTLLWQIDGETGTLLRSRRIAFEEDVSQIAYAEALDSFVYVQRDKKELVVLDARLEETACRVGWPGSYYLREEQFCGSIVYEQFPNKGAFRLVDLRSGGANGIRLEVPAFCIRLLPDGRILGWNEKQNVLTVFDREGAVISRCRVPGLFTCVLVDNDCVCLAELRGPDTGALVYGALFDETETHVWRLDPAKRV